MDTVKTIFTNWFFWGFALGMVFCVLSLVSHNRTLKELKRLKGHLSDKLEIEADKLSEMKGALNKLKGENENLRLKVGGALLKGDAVALERELEILARAEKAMVLNAPGFAQAWENAKQGALNELEMEDSGKSLPRRIFQRFFNRGGTSIDAEVTPTLTSESTTKRSRD
jgi:hypothetical protein